MRAWILTLAMLTITTPVIAGTPLSEVAPGAGKPIASLTDAGRAIAYRMPVGLKRTSTTPPDIAASNRRIDRALSPEQPLAPDAQLTSVRNALRDSHARRGGALSGGIEWRVNGGGNELGLGGGLRRIVDALRSR